MTMYVISLSYNGQRYHGWQVQPNADTVQAELHRVLSRIFKTDTLPYPSGCSRTDAGVHALEYVATTRAIRNIPPDNLVRGLNSLLPRDIRVHSVTRTDTFRDARSLVVGKHYRYIVFNGSVSSPFSSPFSWHSPYPLDVQHMNVAARAFEGTHDFSGFQASGTDVTHTVRTIYRATVSRVDDFILLDWIGDGFLKHQVRTMSGLLVAVGKGKISAETVSEIIASRDKSLNADTLPGKGLFLFKLFGNNNEMKRYSIPKEFYRILWQPIFTR